MKIKDLQQNNFGQSLFEVVFAIAIAAIILTGVVSLATTSVRNVNTSENQSLAANQARSAVDWLREERDDDWDNLAGHIAVPGPTWCLDNLDWTQSGACGATDFVSGTDLTREVTLVTVDSSTIGANVTVSWTDAQGKHTEELSTQFTNWQSGTFESIPAFELCTSTTVTTCEDYCLDVGKVCVDDGCSNVRCSNSGTDYVIGVLSICTDCYASPWAPGSCTNPTFSISCCCQ